MCRRAGVVALALLGAVGCHGGGRIVVPVTLEEPAPALHYTGDFLMTDYLIRRHGFESLLRYFKAFAAGRGRHESFRLGFGQGLQEFEREMLRHFGRVLR
jgi:hypothetical protein